MIRFLLFFCSLFFLVICEEKIDLNEDYDVSRTVKAIISGESKGQDIPNDLKIVSQFYENPKPELFSKQEISLTCLACEAAVTGLIDLFLLGVDVDTIENALEGLCDLLGVIDMEVCHGGIANYAPIIEYIIINREPQITAGEVCAAVVGPGCGAWEEINNWSVDIPDKTRAGERKGEKKNTQGARLRVLHLTDIHLDLTYTVGNEADCGLPMCCGNSSGVAASEERAAGFWGDYNCDIPTWSYKRMLEHIRMEHDLDYIMITGDYPAHDVWLQSREHNLATAGFVLESLTEVFSDTQVVPSLGNHEPFPCNIIAGSTAGVEGDQFSPDWLLSELSEYFSAWLPGPQLGSFRQEAAYTFSWVPGLRVISFPSPLCLTYNFWLWMDFSDPGNMLVWLIDRLLEAEAAGEKVHILSHVPPGNAECLGAWGREYSRIISRFEETITGQFHGHTHYDHFALHYDPENSTRATGMGFISPSVASYTGLSPGYRIYEVDSDTFKVVDTETWVLDLVTSNAGGADSEPVWYKLYTASESLELEGWEPQDFDKMVRRLATDEEYYDMWHTFLRKAGPGDHYTQQDRRTLLCDLLTTSNLDKSKCDEILGPEM